MANDRITTTWLKEDEQEKNDILKSFYHTLGSLSDEEINGHAGFLADVSNGQHSSTEIKQILKRAKNKDVSPEQFQKFFDWVPPLEAKLIGFNIKEIGVPSWNNSYEDLSHYSISDIQKINDYIEEYDLSVAIGVANIHSNPEIYPPSNHPYAIHSVAKIFTGALLLMMVENQIIEEADLKKEVQQLIDPEVFAMLPVSVQAHLHDKKITLWQLMMHKSGLGDYGYDEGTGTLRDKIKNNEISEEELNRLTDIRNFLNYAEDKIYEEDIKKRGVHYSNLGLTLVGLAIEHAYQKKYPNQSSSKFYDILKKFILDPAGVEISSIKPDNAIWNKEDSIAGKWVGGPAGGYWTTNKDLINFSTWLFKKCQNADFKSFVQRYGNEFYDKDRDVIEHPGLSPSSSAFLSISLKTGNIVSVLSDQKGGALALGLELACGKKAFIPNQPSNVNVITHKHASLDNNNNMNDSYKISEISLFTAESNTKSTAQPNQNNLLQDADKNAKHSVNKKV